MDLIVTVPSSDDVFASACLHHMDDIVVESVKRVYANSLGDNKYGFFCGTVERNDTKKKANMQIFHNTPRQKN